MHGENGNAAPWMQFFSQKNFKEVIICLLRLIEGLKVSPTGHKSTCPEEKMRIAVEAGIACQVEAGCCNCTCTDAPRVQEL